MRVTVPSNRIGEMYILFLKTARHAVLCNSITYKCSLLTINRILEVFSVRHRGSAVSFMEEYPSLAEGGGFEHR